MLRYANPIPRVAPIRSGIATFGIELPCEQNILPIAQVQAEDMLANCYCQISTEGLKTAIRHEFVR